jgi:hypothetical protein
MNKTKTERKSHKKEKKEEGKIGGDYLLFKNNICNQ